MPATLVFMLATFFNKLHLVWSDTTLRNRVLFVLGVLVVFRLLAAIPVPGVNELQLERFLQSNQFVGMLNLFSGGGLSQLSIVMLGVGPFITASIVMQLMTILSPQLKEMYQEEGDAGRQRFSMYSRYLAVPLAFIQAFAYLMLLRQSGVVGELSQIQMLTNVTVIAGGSMLLMWIGELVSEFGVGNGVSLIIFAGIVSSMPSLISRFILTFDATQIPALIAFAVAALVVVAAVVFITEAERPVPVTYSRQARNYGESGGSVTSYMPLRVNQAGVIPIIFALSFLLLPTMFLSVLGYVGVPGMTALSATVATFINGQWFYGSAYFVLVFVFTYFYTAITFEPQTVAKNLQRNGGFIPGIRPGESTAEYIGNIVTRITLVGALFLSIIAVLPIAMRALTGLQAFSVGGTALLIVVSVVLDIIKKIDAQLSIREY
jgi:preprotein translocase subunit SecY